MLSRALVGCVTKLLDKAMNIPPQELQEDVASGILVAQCNTAPIHVKGIQASPLFCTHAPLCLVLYALNRLAQLPRPHDGRSVPLLARISPICAPLIFVSGTNMYTPIYRPKSPTSMVQYCYSNVTWECFILIFIFWIPTNFYVFCFVFFNIIKLTSHAWQFGIAQAGLSGTQGEDTIQGLVVRHYVKTPDEMARLHAQVVRVHLDRAIFSDKYLKD